ncbi:hypothetical protein [Parafrankia sp. FMc2]|uniref:hypothetical protein n=1 Tax=Parafrankia sp. FMc2 TaxID=3233196 RepID=UPI0034D44A57
MILIASGLALLPFAAGVFLLVASILLGHLRHEGRALAVPGEHVEFGRRLLSATVGAHIVHLLERYLALARPPHNTSGHPDRWTGDDALPAVEVTASRLPGSASPTGPQGKTATARLSDSAVAGCWGRW